MTRLRASMLPRSGRANRHSPTTSPLANLFQTMLTRLAWIGFQLNKFMFSQHCSSLLRHEITHNQYNAPSSTRRSARGSSGKTFSMHFVFKYPAQALYRQLSVRLTDSEKPELSLMYVH